jgi:cation diffusion facilitator CzcD-associated flavoprotein CzcO
MSSYDSSTDVAVVGAGPYGLSVATHLSHRNVQHRIFGTPMQTWRSMFPTMGLKSPDFGTTISTPVPSAGFVEYGRSQGDPMREPISTALFAKYGMWLQEKYVPELEPCRVEMVDRQVDGFGLRLETGERVLAQRVVMAIGLPYFRRLPEQFAQVPAELATHTSQNQDLSIFRGRDVTVIGAGESAFEAATLLGENGATVRLLVRGTGAYFADPPSEGSRPLRHRVMYPDTMLGPGRLNYFLQTFPSALHRFMPDERRVRLTRTHLGPWGAWWLRKRFDAAVPEVHVRSRVVEATPLGSRLRLRVQRDGEADRTLETDHVICGTGYEVDLDRIPNLDSELAARLARVERAPRLNEHFESSVLGLYFVGVASAFSFGPLVRFVAGTNFTGPKIARRLAQTARTSIVTVVKHAAPALAKSERPR